MSDKKVAVYIDSFNFISAIRTLNINIDYKKLLKYLETYGFLVTVNYYIQLEENPENNKAQGLIDWLDYNGYQVIIKRMKEEKNSEGKRTFRKVKQITEMSLDAIEIADKVDEIIIISGDGEFEYVVKKLQAKGVRVTVMSSAESSVSVVSDNLRRRANRFIDINSIANEIRKDESHDIENKRIDENRIGLNKTLKVSSVEKIKPTENK